MLVPILALVLSACVIIVDDTNPPGGNLSVSNISFDSDFRAVINGVETPVICDNTFTPARVIFKYSGDLASWRIQFRGTNTGQTSTAQEFTYGGPNYSENKANRIITTNYVFGSGTAPLNVKPQAIVVVPVPKQIGTTTLLLTIRNSAGKEASGQFGGLPVIDNCP